MTRKKNLSLVGTARGTRAATKQSHDLAPLPYKTPTTVAILFQRTNGINDTLRWRYIKSRASFGIKESSYRHLPLSVSYPSQQRCTKHQDIDFTKKSTSITEMLHFFKYFSQSKQNFRMICPLKW
jgi:hypothetical protein